MARDGTKNLIPLNERTKEEQKEITTKGGKASGQARREKSTMKKTLEMLLDEKSKNGKTYRELATLGLIKGAMSGNANNYRTILEIVGELTQLEEDKQKKELSKVEELLNRIEEEAKK